MLRGRPSILSQAAGERKGCGHMEDCTERLGSGLLTRMLHERGGEGEFFAVTGP